MKKLTNFFKKLWKDESAQGATEYILLLVIVVGLVFLLKDRIKPIIDGKISELGGLIDSIKGN